MNLKAITVVDVLIIGFMVTLAGFEAAMGNNCTAFLLLLVGAAYSAVAVLEHQRLSKFQSCDTPSTWGR